MAIRSLATPATVGIFIAAVRLRARCAIVESCIGATTFRSRHSGATAWRREVSLEAELEPGEKLGLFGGKLLVCECASVFEFCESLDHGKHSIAGH